MRRLTVMIPCIVGFVLLVSLMGPTQGQEGTVTKTYRMAGSLQAIDLTQRWAIIGGLQWPLAQDFDKERFPTLGTGKIEYPQPMRVIFFVRCKEQAPAGEPVAGSTTVERITALESINEINERGCEVYAIERAPM